MSRFWVRLRPRIVALFLHFLPLSPTDCCRLACNGCIFVLEGHLVSVHFVFSPVFSYTSPEVPSFLTSVRLRAPFWTLEWHIREPPQWGVMHRVRGPKSDVRGMGLRQSANANPPPAEILHPLRGPRIFVPRIPTPEFRPADFVAWMGSPSRRQQASARK
jgi:hypothetical protein